jgi:hypothetical protein
VRESKEASAALKAAAADACSALVDNFRHLRSLKTVYNVEDYHIGMPFGIIHLPITSTNKLHVRRTKKRTIEVDEEDGVLALY